MNKLISRYLMLNKDKLLAGNIQSSAATFLTRDITNGRPVGILGDEETWELAPLETLSTLGTGGGTSTMTEVSKISTKINEQLKVRSNFGIYSESFLTLFLILLSNAWPEYLKIKK